MHIPLYVPYHPAHKLHVHVLRQQCRVVPLVRRHQPVASVLIHIVRLQHILAVNLSRHDILIVEVAGSLHHQQVAVVDVYANHRVALRYHKRHSPTPCQHARHHHHLWWDVTHLIRQSTTDTHLIERHWCIAHQLFIHLQDFTITHHFIPSCL